MRIMNWSITEEKASDSYENYIYNCERYFSNQIYTIADEIYDKIKCKIILVAGPSSSGKTTFANLLANRLENKGVKVHRVSTDDFFKNRAEVPRLPNGKYDFDTLNAMDIPLFKKTVKLILTGGKVPLPSFDFKSGIKTNDATSIYVQDSDITIIEGIHALNPSLIGTYELDTKMFCGIFIRPALTCIFPNKAVVKPNEVRLLRRSIRDYYTRGFSLEQTADQWQEVLAAEQETIYQYIELADYRVDSFHPYELYVYKNCFGDILEKAELPVYDNLKRALESIVAKPRVKIPENSLLNEFALWGEEN